MKTMGEFSKYLVKKYREYEDGLGRRSSVSEWARHLGVSQPSLNRWMIGDAMPEVSNLRRLAELFGDEVYLLVGFPLGDLPPDADSRVAAALADLSTYLSAQSLPLDSPEAGRLLISLLRDHGFTLSFKE